MAVLVRHDQGCQVRTGHSDAAKRISDMHNLHRIGGGYAVIGHWLAFKLEDGTTDGTVYDTRKDAIFHQLHESLCTYVQIKPNSMSVCAAEVMIKIARRLYDAGLRMSDPEDMRREPIRRNTWEDQLAQANGNGMSNLEWPAK